ncbi:hypothetical protein BD324DRAFT_616657 [Kockovaella imperatae]|uniref:Ribosomal RNA-processing protein 40 n=1 Tax=Kockovaella imperatae TaxID=4999 RepID=A0A1Y1UQ59_9TREE|nr:hypothetical protein BD324DRAFT_616657 [Kockovaella imperatae]ORX40171.1 hypothetical protein BD324DRAFT_616657 [Kockovaella imperatae]
MTFVLPGDVIPTATSQTSFGPGLAPLDTSNQAGPSRARGQFTSSTSSEGNSTESARVVATKAGTLVSSDGKGKKGGVWIESNSRRYTPASRDLVLGTIIARHADGYRVDIGSASMASLDALAFEGATKRSKPNLKVGTLIYARVSLASRDMEPELECFDPATGKSDGFGELKEGLVVDCSLQLCRRLLTPKNPLLPILASVIPFEIAIGLNGRIWFKSSSIDETIALQRVIQGIDDGSLAETKGELEKALKAYMA